MNKSEKIILGFEAKAKKIIHKYTVHAGEQPVKYGHLRMSGFFGNFNNAFSKVNEELSRESLGVLSRFINNEEVDFVILAEKLHQQKNKAKMEFIQRLQPVPEYS